MLSGSAASLLSSSANHLLPPSPAAVVSSRWMACASWAALRRRRYAQVSRCRSLAWLLGHCAGGSPAPIEAAGSACKLLLRLRTAAGAPQPPLRQQTLQQRLPLSADPQASFLPPIPTSPADAKVVSFYRKLRERQLLALGLDPAQFKTIY